MMRFLVAATLAGGTCSAIFAIGAPVVLAAERASEAQYSSIAHVAVHEGRASVDGKPVFFEYRTWQDGYSAVEEYRTSDGHVFRAELDKDSGVVQVFRDGSMVNEMSMESLQLQFAAAMTKHENVFQRESLMGQGQREGMPRSNPGCSVGTFAVSTANGLLWGAVGLAVPPAAPVAYVAGAVTSGVIGAAGTQC